MANLGAETEGPCYLHIGWDGADPFRVDANLIATGRTCVIGASGSGKSYAVGVICEELCKNSVPFAVVDTEGEHFGLKEKYEAIWVGEDEKCDIRWDTFDFDELAAQAPDIAPLILDVSETSDSRQKVGGLLSGIYSEVDRRRTPYLLIVEEADRFVPQDGEKLAIFGEVARRGRKRGMGLVVCTQRPSLVDKNVLSQCGNQLIGRLVIRNDLQAVAQFFSGHELPKQLTSMGAGVFYALGGLSPLPKRITIRARETHHGGVTPKIVSRVLKPFRPTRSREVPTQSRSDGQTALGFNPTVRAEEVPELVKRSRSHLLFGEKETVTGAQLVYRPLVEVGVSSQTGMFKKRTETKFVLLDGQTGRFVDLGETPVFREGLERFLGLAGEQVEILRAMKPNEELSLVELANKVGVSKELLRRRMRPLEEKRLVRTAQVGRTRTYRRLVNFPEFRWTQMELPLEAVSDRSAKRETSFLDERSVSAAMRCLTPHSDLQSFRQFVYPLYRVELTLKGKKRVVWLDARDGRELRL